MTGPFYGHLLTKRQIMPNATTELSPRSSIGAGRISIFEGLRAYLAWWVVGCHILAECGFDQKFLPGVLRVMRGGGGEAVCIFIILSGFAIMHLLATKKEPYRIFILRRFFRLYPAFIIAVIIGMIFIPQIRDLCSYLKTGIQQGSNLETRWIEYSEHFWRYIPTSFTMLHGAVPRALLPHAQEAFVPPGWSISLEWQFYLLAPFILCIARRAPFTSILAITILAVTSVHWPIGGWGSFLPQRGQYFLLGCLSYTLYHRLPKVPLGGTIPLTAWVSLFWIALFPEWHAVLIGSYDFTLGPWLPLGIWSLMFAIALDYRASPQARGMSLVYWTFNNRLTQTLGKISFSTYLYHYFALFIGLALFRATKLPETKYNALMVAAPVTIILSLAFSFIIYHIIEKPGVNAGAWYCRRLTATSSTNPISEAPKSP